MSLKRGMSAVKESLDRSQGVGPKASKYEQTNWFYWKAGETKVVRFLTDANELYVVTVHENVETFDGKKKTFACRANWGESCELCSRQQYKRDLGYAIAVLREPAYDEVDGQRKLVGYKDVVTTYETSEGTKKKPTVGIVSQAMRNFWSPIGLIAERYGSLKDRDIEIVRQGQTTDTQYMPFALDPKPIENIDERYAKFLPDLEAFLNRIGSLEYYDAQLRGIKPEKKDTPVASSDDYEDEYEEESYDDLGEETEAERLRKKLASN